MHSKKFLTFFLFGIISVGIIFFILSKAKPVETPPVVPLPTPVPVLRPPVLKPTPTLVVSEVPVRKVNVSGVLVNDFFQLAKHTNKSGDVLFVDTEKYQILYLGKYNKFLISILSSPFLEIKKEAEGDFIKTLGVNQADACRLPVETTTPFFANPDYSGAIYTLGFCQTGQ